MNGSTIGIIIALTIAVLAALYLLFIKNIKKKQVKGQVYNLSIDLNTLITALKGKENISSVSATSSKVRFELKDTSVDVDSIKALGASGIVESNNSITIIFGKQSQSICDAIKGEIEK